MSETDILRRLEENPPYWASEVIRDWPGDDWLESRKAFVTSHYWADSASINIRRVIGTDHPDYQGQTWGWFLRNGKRMGVNIPLLHDNPDYYHETVRKEPPMFYISVNGHDWFVHGDGNHRTCIARFYLEGLGLHTLHGVSVNDYRIDHALHDLYRCMEEAIRERRLPFRIQAARKKLWRSDGPGWQLEKFKPRIELRDGKRTWSAETPMEASRMREWLEAPAFRRWFAVGGWQKD